MKKIILYILFVISSFLLWPCKVQAQKHSNVVCNLPKYDTHWLHFGFIIGVNSTNFILKQADNFYFLDTLKSLESVSKLGFNLGIVADVMFTEFVGIRFIPDIAFAERDLQYAFAKNDVSYMITKKVESTFLNFPLDLKIKSQRINNYGGYLVVGAKYSIDLISQKNVDNNISGVDVVRLRKNDLAYEVGAGLDIYLTYFKFAIEAKLAIGTKDLLIKDQTIYSTAIDKLNSKVFLISFTFEGGE